MDLQIFSNSEFGEIRTATINGEPWFVGKDVAEALGYSDTNKAVAVHVDDEDKLNDKTASSLGQRGGWFINESGLYSLVLSSKLPTAKKFKRWVTSEVLPSIRKNGGYIAGQENLSDEELMARALLVAHNTIAERDKLIKEQGEQLEEQKPKVLFADAVSTSKTSILIGDLAKLLKQNGYDTGQQRLFEQLRNEGYLIKGGSSKNMPTQRAYNMGLFEVKESTIYNPDDSVRITRTTKVTGKGQIYFINRYCKNTMYKQEELSL